MLRRWDVYVKDSETYDPMYDTMEKKCQRLNESSAWCRFITFIIIPLSIIYLIYQVYDSYRNARARSKRGDALDFDWWSYEAPKSLMIVLLLALAALPLSMFCGTARELAQQVRESIPNGPTT
jgi:hypothetical protein